MRKIMNQISELELAEFHSIVNMTCCDATTNFTEPHNFISHKISELKEIFVRVFEPLVSTVKTHIEKTDASEDNTDTTDVTE